MVMPPSSSELPVNYHGFRLENIIGNGCLTDAYLATPPGDMDLPSRICMKIISNPYGMYTEQSAKDELKYQSQVLCRIKHPFIIKCYHNVLPDVDEAMATELAVCTVQDLQNSIDFSRNYKTNILPPIVVKYLAAQICLAVAHLHRHKLRWGDPKQANMVMMKDFTLRLIDIGDSRADPDRDYIDFCYIAGMLNNMSTSSDEEFVQQKPPYYRELVERYCNELQPSLYDLLRNLAAQRSFKDILGHHYWTQELAGESASSVQLTRGNPEESILSLREAAWCALPEHVRQWFIQCGGSAPCILATPAVARCQQELVSAEKASTSFPNAFTSFPADFRGYKLVKLLGRGYLTDAYLAEPPAGSTIPSVICVKIITSSRNADWYTEAAATEELKYQRNLLLSLDHPFVIKCLGDVLSDLDYVIATEAGVCSLEQFQHSFDTGKAFQANVLPPTTVKYLAAQLCTGIAYLHRQGVAWGSAKQANVVIMHDFTIRIIDIGKAQVTPAERKWKDFRFIVGMIVSMATTSEAGFQNNLTFYEDLVERYRGELGGGLSEILTSLLQETPFETLLYHPYWNVEIGNDPTTSVNLVGDTSAVCESLMLLRKPAWQALPHHVREWFTEESSDVTNIPLRSL